MEERKHHDETGDTRGRKRALNLVGQDRGSLGLGRTLVGMLLAASLIGAIIGGFIVGYALPYLYGGTPGAVFSTRQDQPTSASKEIIKVNGASSLVGAVAKKLGPSVVNIDVNQGPQDAIHSGLMSGVGSGVIYSADGYIITNNHVVSGARKIFVTIGTDEVEAKIIATDPETDLAVIKVNQTGLPVAEFGSSKDLQVGEPTVAIGSPYGFEHTVTSGIISAVNRNVTVPNDQNGANVTYTNLIQTDAAINPGNSGGALSDAKGRVIGINALIISDSGASDGVGFAIPVELVKKIADQLIRQGKASHPYIGIQGSNVTDLIGEEPEGEVDTDEGAIITNVVPGGPAATAGLAKNDIITAVDGAPIKNMDGLVAATRQKDVGDSVEITYVRNGKENKVSVTLVEKPS